MYVTVYVTGCGPQNITNQGNVSFMFENKMVYLNSLVHKQGFFAESSVSTILLELASISKNLSFQIFVVLHTTVYISGSRPPNTLQIRERIFTLEIKMFSQKSS